MRLKIPAALAAKTLGLRAQPATPVTQNWRLRDELARAAVRQSYREHAERIAAAKATRPVNPLGRCVVTDDGVLMSVADYWRNP